jgi:hypothetical protein
MIRLIKSKSEKTKLKIQKEHKDISVIANVATTTSD